MKEILKIAKVILLIKLLEFLEDNWIAKKEQDAGPVLFYEVNIKNCFLLLFVVYYIFYYMSNLTKNNFFESFLIFNNFFIIFNIIF